MSIRWYNSVSSYQQMQNWSARQKVWRQYYESRLQDATSALGDAITSTGSNTATFTMQKALARIKLETAAKQQAAAKAAQTPESYTKHFTLNGSTVTLSNGDTIDLNDNPDLAGGSSLNTGNNTLTLKNGTVIDLTTGYKKIDVLAPGIAVTA
jgi:hypothetical protein